MTDANKGATYSFDLCGQCKTCCCQDAKPPLTNRRKRILKHYLKEQKIKLGKLFDKKDYSYPSVDDEIYCNLFDKKTGKCLVHTVKPETCVAGPITFDINFCTKKVEWFLKKSTVCAYAGVLYGNKTSFSSHFEVARKQIMQLILDLGADELRSIAKINEPETFKVGEDDLPFEVTERLDL